jgi:hypothetical protein
MPEVGTWLGNDEEHGKETHRRWVHKTNRLELWDTDEWREEWGFQQCGACRYFIHLTGYLINDWGICSNPESEFDGTAMFEHDGCEQFAEARDSWGGPRRSYNHLRGHHYGEPPHQAARPRIERTLGSMYQGRRVVLRSRTNGSRESRTTRRGEVARCQQEAYPTLSQAMAGTEEPEAGIGRLPRGVDLSTVRRLSILGPGCRIADRNVGRLFQSDIPVRPNGALRA